MALETGDSETAESRESERLASLHSYGLLDTPAEPQFDRIVALARVLFDTPIAAISLVDQDRQWFKAREGLSEDQTRASRVSAVTQWSMTRCSWCKTRARMRASPHSPM